MIKVNLLRDQSSRVHRTHVKSNASTTVLIFVAIALLASGVLGAWTIALHQQVQTSSEKRSKLRLEEARLQALQKEIERFERLKQLRQSRIDVIEKLKAGQKGPVLLLNNIIRSIPRDGLLWLTSLTQKGERVTIVGSTQQAEILPDFITNLMTCGIFQSVDLETIDSQKESSKFSLICITGKKTEAELQNGH